MCSSRNLHTSCDTGPLGPFFCLCLDKSSFLLNRRETPGSRYHV